VDQVAAAGADHRRRRMAKFARIGGAGIDVATLGVEQCDQIAGVLGDQTIALFALAQFLPGQMCLPFADLECAQGLGCAAGAQGGDERHDTG
jgi:hypothetical protein